MNQEIEWKHENGTDSIVTRPSGNTYIGKEANNLMFEMYAKQRNNEFAGIEFDNQLIIQLGKRKEWTRIPNEEIKQYEQQLAHENI